MTASASVLCETCGRQVDELRRWYDAHRCVTIFEARCHGATERTEISDRDLVGEVIQIVGGIAFRITQLEEKKHGHPQEVIRRMARIPSRRPRLD